MLFFTDEISFAQNIRTQFFAIIVQIFFKFDYCYRVNVACGCNIIELCKNKFIRCAIYFILFFFDHFSRTGFVPLCVMHRAIISIIACNV